MAAPSTHQQDVLPFLASPAAYGPQCTHVERIDTHISVVFLAEDRAHKLQHDVHFPYVAAKLRGYLERAYQLGREF